MIDLTAEQISAAKANDLTAVTAVIEATEERVMQLARKYAANGAYVDDALVEDLAQVGRIAVWQAIGRFEGKDVAQFFTFIDRTLNGALSDERRTLTRSGVSPQAVKDFETALTVAAGDPYEAQRLVCTADVMGARKMSPELAYAARMAWQGATSIDHQFHSPKGSGYREGNPESDKAMTPAQFLVSEIGIPEDLLTTADVVSARQREVRKTVHATLDKLSDRMSGVLRRDYGFRDVPHYTDGTKASVGSADEEMAADMGVTVYQLQQARTKGKARFRELYLKGANA
jgi:RNA polymerase sigma factor (sigma-70 family)